MSALFFGDGHWDRGFGFCGMLDGEKWSWWVHHNDNDVWMVCVVTLPVEDLEEIGKHWIP